MSTVISIPKPRPITLEQFEKLASDFIDWLESIPEQLRFREEPEMIALMFLAHKFRRGELT